MPDDRIVLYNYTKGSVLAEVILPKPRIGGKWVRLFQDEKRRMMVEHPKVHTQAYYVLSYLETIAGWDNGLPTAAETAQALGLLREAVSRCYGELVATGFLVKQDRRYFINPLICWKGTERQWQEAVAKLVDQPRQQQLVAP